MKVKPKIYAFDFDGTIVTNEFPKVGKPIIEVINLIHEFKKQGHYVILYTMREGQYLDDALNFCKSWRIFFDAVNDNLPHMKEFYKNNPRKIFANYYIDDHNLYVDEINSDPQQPIMIPDEGFDTGKSAHLCCPSCRKPIVNVWSSVAYEPKHCHYCGQKLDWSSDHG